MLSEKMKAAISLCVATRAEYERTRAQDDHQRWGESWDAMMRIRYPVPDTTSSEHSGIVPYGTPYIVPAYARMDESCGAGGRVNFPLYDGPSDPRAR